MDAPELANAIRQSRTDGTRRTKRAALARAGREFGDNVRLMEARRELLLEDESKTVRVSALAGLAMSAARALSLGQYPHGAREAIELGLDDPKRVVRKWAGKYLKEFDAYVAQIEREKARS